MPPLSGAHVRPESLAFAGIPLIVLAWRAGVLARRPTGGEISPTIGLLVLGIVPLDASILLARGLPLACLAVLLLLPMAMFGLWSFKRV